MTENYIKVEHVGDEVMRIIEDNDLSYYETIALLEILKNEVISVGTLE